MLEKLHAMALLLLLLMLLMMMVGPEVRQRLPVLLQHQAKATPETPQLLLLLLLLLPGPRVWATARGTVCMVRMQQQQQQHCLQLATACSKDLSRTYTGASRLLLVA